MNDKSSFTLFTIKGSPLEADTMLVEHTDTGQTGNTCLIEGDLKVTQAQITYTNIKKTHPSSSH